MTHARARSPIGISPSIWLPVHADIPDVDAVLLDGRDDKANVLGVKGLGELGTCGAGASVANAVFNGTGVRVRDYPITLDKLLPNLTALDEAPTASTDAPRVRTLGHERIL